MKIFEKIKQILNTMFDKRYIIALIILVICLLFKVNGSSLGTWSAYLNNNPNINDGVILGTTKPIRSDEYAVLTPFMFSQKYNHFKPFTNIIRASKTNVMLIYALPCISVIQLFRPFQLGFLIGNNFGLSFFFCARFLALFLATIEFFMLLTNKNKLLSFIGGVLVTLAPVLSWWFAINGLVEMLVFGEGFIILVDKYMNNDNFKRRIIYLFLMFICAGGYILTFYPAWQIPLAYVFLSLLIYIIIKNKDKTNITKKDIISIIVTIILLIIILGTFIYISKDDLKLILNTDYPGARMETGGGMADRYILYPLSIFLPFIGSPISTNQCEASLFFTLFPLGIILSIFDVKNNKDKLSIIMLIFYIFLSIYVIFGFPKFLAKISLLYVSQSNRTVIALGYMDIILLIKALSDNNINLSRNKDIIISLFLAFTISLLNNYIYPDFYNKYHILLIFIILFVLFYLALRYNYKNNKYIFAILITILMICIGLTVNPIRIGSSILTDNELLINAEKINQKDDGIWAFEGNYPLTNLLIVRGLKTFNSTNVYPNLDRWYSIDKNHNYKKIYNRYAHIDVSLDKNKDKFKLLGVDHFIVYLNEDDLKHFKIKYIVSPKKDLEEKSNKKIIYIKKYNYIDKYYIYKLKY